MKGMIKSKTKQAKSAVVLVAALALAVLSVVAALAFRPKSANAKAFFLSNLYQTEGMDVTQNAAVPASLGITDNTNGILFTSDKAGSKISFANTFSGAFDLKFRVYSDTTYSGDYGGSQYKNNALDLRELQLKFTDRQTGKSFTLIVAGGEAYGSIIPSALVRVGSVKLGLHYAGAAETESLTYIRNFNGMRTRLNGTTFCNLANTKSGDSVSGSMPTELGFDPYTMQVYGYNYNTSTGARMRRVILDLDDPKYIGEKNCLSGFNEYNVEAVFASITVGRTAKLLMYALNGQSLSGSASVSDTHGPAVVLSDNYCGVVGETSYLPNAVTAYDLIDEKIAFDGTVSLTDPSGNAVTVTKIADGYAYSPTAAGIYTAVYTARDSSGNLGMPYTVPVTVLAAAPEISFAYDHVIGEVGRTAYKGKNSMVTVPTAYANSALGRGAITVNTELTAPDGEKKAVAAGDTVTLSKTGTYRLMFSASDRLGKSKTEEFVFEVCDAVFDGEALAPVYNRNDIISVPAKTVSGGASEHAVSFPDGRNSTNAAIKADALGEYRVIYSNAGQTAFHTEYFKVIDDYAALFEANDSFTVENNKELSDSVDVGGRGLGITSRTDGAELVYNGVLNLSENTIADTLLKFSVTPKTAGTADMTRVIFTFRDIHDPSIYMSINVRRDFWGQYHSVRVSVKTDSMADYGTRGYYSGAVISAAGEIGGAMFNHSFYGKYNDSFVARPIEIYYDHAARTLHGFPFSYAVSAETPWMFMDFNDPAYQAGTTWRGFTTGEVTMSVSLQGLSGSSASMMLYTLNKNDLSGDSVVDTVPPDIVVDYNGENQANLPSAGVGVPFKLFSASAYDLVDGKTGVQTDVYIKKSGGMIRQIYDDEAMRFIPQEAGEYYIRYSAVDQSGNYSEKRISFFVYDVLPELQLAFPGGGIPLTASLGEELLLRAPTVLGGSGVKTITRRVSFGGEEVAVTENILVLTKSGEYTVVYRVKDYNGEKDFTYTIAVSETGVPAVEPPSVPIAILAGSEYVFAPLEAYVYTAAEGKKAAKVSLSVTLDGVTTPLQAFTFTPPANAGGKTLTLNYRAENPENATLFWAQSYEVKLISPVTIGDYFYTNGLSRTYKTTSAVYAATGANPTLDYINKLVAGSFEFAFRVPKDANEFSAVTVTLTDTKRASERIVISVLKGNASESPVHLNGVRVGAIKSATFFGSADPFLLKLNLRTGTVSDYSGAVLFKVGTYESGRTFAGFSSGKLLMNVSLDGVSGASGIEIVKLGNQIFYDTAEDTIKPTISLGDEFRYMVDPGAVVKVPYAIAGDILSPVATCVVTVTAPDGTDIYYRTDISEDLYFTASQFGYYSIVYIATDGAGNRFPLDFAVRIIDLTPPTVTVAGNVPTTAKTGATVKLPSATVSDDYSKDLSYNIFVITPDGSFIMVAEHSFVASVKGEYRIIYSAEDEFGNLTAESYILVVA